MLSKRKSSLCLRFAKSLHFTSLALICAACTSAQMDQLTESVKKGVSNGLSGTPGTDSWGASSLPPELEHVFANSPFTDARTSQYPRVAFTVLAFPPNHADPWANFGGAGAHPTGCWMLSAVVWKNAKDSTKTAPFKACFPDILPQAKVTADLYVHWWQTVDKSRTNVSARNIGAPPSTVFPQGLAYVRYFDSRSTPVGPGYMTVESWLWTAVLYRLDFDPSKFADRRVWIDKYTPLES
jgi:hypothetical protein